MSTIKYCPECKAPHFEVEVYKAWIRDYRKSKNKAPRAQVQRWEEVVRRHESEMR